MRGGRRASQRPQARKLIVVAASVVLGCLLSIGAAWASPSKLTPDCADALLGLPPVPLSAEHIDSRWVRLGEKVFSDSRLSADGLVSCASCHPPDQHFADSRAQAEGVKGRKGTRNTPSLLNIVYVKDLFWDGRTAGLESQALLPLLNPIEHGLPSEVEIVRILAEAADYQAEFNALGIAAGQITVADVQRALASYQATLRSGGTAFDRFMFRHEKSAMSPAAIRGLELFRGRAQCAKCHTIESDSALLTDLKFHKSPLGLPTDVLTELAAITTKIVEIKKQHGAAELNGRVSVDARLAALGRFVVTLSPADIGTFRTPSLRNVVRTAPYMHDGSVTTLEEAADLELYGLTDVLRRPIVLSADEKADLLEFLSALTDSSPVDAVLAKTCTRQ